ncbi:MAG: flagellar type III secretion system pore protein FliP [Chloroflexi bacterium]|nr:flagellar type III secretion system pore protein FliP [Chloroflexota bacterium]
MPALVPEPVLRAGETERAGRRGWWPIALAALLLLLTAGCAATSSSGAGSPDLTLKIDQTSVQTSPSFALEALVALTVLSLVPAILLMTTSFIRIVIVLSFTRSALGLPQTPPNQVLLGLALFLTGFIMWPVWQQANADGIQAYLKGDIPIDVAIERSSQPIRAFMFHQTRQSELALFVRLARIPPPNGPEDVPTHVLIPAFMLSELKTAFQMGFMILVPFLVIDLVVASLVMSLGMVMLPPTTLSLPFKVLLFVLADGWTLVVQSLIQSFQQ